METNIFTDMLQQLSPLCKDTCGIVSEYDAPDWDCETGLKYDCKQLFRF